jgi:hypothetical protein
MHVVVVRKTRTANGSNTKGTNLDSNFLLVLYSFHPSHPHQTQGKVDRKEMDGERHTTAQSTNPPNHHRHLDEEFRHHEEVEPDGLVDEVLVVEGLDVVLGDAEHPAWDQVGWVEGLQVNDWHVICISMMLGVGMEWERDSERKNGDEGIQRMRRTEGHGHCRAEVDEVEEVALSGED